MDSAAVILDGREPQAGVSHVVGGVTSPLIEDTIPAVLKDTAARFGDRDAAIFPAQNIHWTYAEFDHQVDRLAGGAARAWFPQGRPGRHMGTKPRRMVARAIRDRARRDYPGEYQPSLSGL